MLCCGSVITEVLFCGFGCCFGGCFRRPLAASLSISLFFGLFFIVIPFRAKGPYPLHCPLIWEPVVTLYVLGNH